MAAVVPILLKSSRQYILQQNKISGASSDIAPGEDIESKVRRSNFNLTLESQVVGTYGLGRIPKGAVIHGIKWCNSVSLGSSTITFGVAGADGSGFIDAAGTVADDAAGTLLFFKNPAAVSTVTTGQSCADSIAQNFMYKTEKELILTLIVAAATLPASGTLKGYIEYTEAR
jgi:hypothetical protein